MNLNALLLVYFLWVFLDYFLMAWLLLLGVLDLRLLNRFFADIKSWLIILR